MSILHSGVTDNVRKEEIDELLNCMKLLGLNLKTTRGVVDGVKTEREEEIIIEDGEYLEQQEELGDEPEDIVSLDSPPPASTTSSPSPTPSAQVEPSSPSTIKKLIVDAVNTTMSLSKTTKKSAKRHLEEPDTDPLVAKEPKTGSSTSSPIAQAEIMENEEPNQIHGFTRLGFTRIAKETPRKPVYLNQRPEELRRENDVETLEGQKSQWHTDHPYSVRCEEVSVSIGNVQEAQEEPRLEGDKDILGEGQASHWHAKLFESNLLNIT